MEILSALRPGLNLRSARRLLIALGCVYLFGAAARAEDTLEYQVKAGFLFNFPKYITWPEEDFAGPNSPLVICVLGNDPFGPGFDRAIQGETVKKRPLQIKRVHRVEDLEECHVLYVSPAEQVHMPRILQKLRGKNTLTVGDTEDFTRSGGMVRFFLADGRVRFEINIDAARRTAMKISAQLLDLARIFREAK